MNCNNFEDNISAYLDGELRGTEKASFAAHRLSCLACRHLFSDVREVMTDVNDYASIELHNSVETLEARIMDATSAGEMLSCTEFDKMIEKYFDGVILAPTFQNFQSHFEGCWKCRRLLKGIEEAKDMMREAKEFEMEVPHRLKRKIMAATVGSNSDTFFDKLSHSLKVGQWVATFLIFSALGLFIDLRYGGVEQLATQTGENAERVVNQNQDMFNQFGAVAMVGANFVKAKFENSKSVNKGKRESTEESSPTSDHQPPTPTSPSPGN